ncbi:MAG TPA: hypothetical protein PK867_23535 [Pirellulales bacterium]|nr:hypothetical protein [Pirellulales bacterium]
MLAWPCEPVTRNAGRWVVDCTEVKDEQGKVIRPGTYITKDTILAIYEELAAAIASGRPYPTRLDPPPGPPADEAGKFIPMADWDQANWPSHIHPPRQ